MVILISLEWLVYFAQTNAESTISHRSSIIQGRGEEWEKLQTKCRHTNTNIPYSLLMAQDA